MIRQLIDIPFNSDKSDIEVFKCLARTEFSVEWHLNQFFIMFLEMVVSVGVDYIYLFEQGRYVFEEGRCGLFCCDVVALCVPDVVQVLKGIAYKCFT